MGLSDLASLSGVGAAVGVLATYGAYTGISAAAGGTVLSSLGGALAWMSGGAISLGGGLAAMALIGGVGAASVIAILGVLSDKKMEKKLEDVKAYCCYNRSLYSQEEIDQLCVTVSTLMTLSAFLKVPIIDKDQKLQEKAQRALEIMKRQMDSLENGHYDVKMIQSRQKDLKNL
ncbi:hypothetical protein HpKG86_07110 [Helicobacter pylori]